MARPRRSPWLLAWLAIANGWSNERLAAEYLRCWDRPLDGRLDVFTSFRSMDDGRGGYSLFARDFYNSWLRYWPARLGRLVVYAEDDAKTAAVVGRLVGCLGAACAEPRVAVASYDVSRATRAPHKVAGAAAAVNANFTALDDVQMQAWKYVLDLLSDAEYLAVLDDDSCLQDVVLPRGDLAACDGRLVVRGVRFERRPGRPTKHEASNGAIGVDSDVNFMVRESSKRAGNSRHVSQVDFPVVFHRGHLAAFRAHVVETVLGERDVGDVARFWAAFRLLLARGWRPSEYSNLMGFALGHPAWRDRYDFQIVPNAHRPVMAMASHKLGACPAAPPVAGRDAAAFVDAHFETLFFPFDAKPYLGDRGGLAENDWNGVVPAKAWAAYERAVRDRGVFRRFLLDRQGVVANYTRAGLGRSPADFCADVTAAWASCFRDVRTAAGVAWTGWNIYRPPEGG